MCTHQPPLVTCLSGAQIREFRHALGDSHGVDRWCPRCHIGRRACLNRTNMGTLWPLQSLANHLLVICHRLWISYSGLSCDQLLRRAVTALSGGSTISFYRDGGVMCVCVQRPTCDVRRSCSCRRPKADDRRRLRATPDSRRATGSLKPEA